MSKILVAPLDWGLGHATRCIPIIRNLLEQNNEIYIAAERSIETLLRTEFPQLNFIPLKGYRITYSTVLPVWLKILVQLPSIIFTTISEHRWLKKIIEEHQIDTVISDNRFGLWNKNVHSIYITHQLRIKSPITLFEPLLIKIHRWIINHYNECWIPDYEASQNLSGDLSHGMKLPHTTKYIGPLSRFTPCSTYDLRLTTYDSQPTYDLCILISGPEPSRTEFEKQMRNYVKSFKGNWIMILGKPGAQQEEPNVYPHLPADELNKIICLSKHIICRAGYSTIMDLHVLQKPATFIPTKGQTEQEYLASINDSPLKRAQYSYQELPT